MAKIPDLNGNIGINVFFQLLRILLEKSYSNGGSYTHKKILLNTEQTPLQLKDFYNEVRGLRDVTHLLDEAQILLDVYASDINVVAKM